MLRKFLISIFVVVALYVWLTPDQPEEGSTWNVQASN